MNNGYRVTGVPIDEADTTQGFVVECSECGPLGHVTEEQVHTTCLDHLDSHGVDTTPWRTPA